MKILCKEIQMIAFFKKDGKIEPLKFKITDDEGIEQVIHIDKITSVIETKKAGIIAIEYSCQSVINRMSRIYEIKYRVNEHKWELYKM